MKRKYYLIVPETISHQQFVYKGENAENVHKALPAIELHQVDGGFGGDE
jgi:hypothetical protein